MHKLSLRIPIVAVYALALIGFAIPAYTQVFPEDVANRRRSHDYLLRQHGFSFDELDPFSVAAGAPAPPRPRAPFVPPGYEHHQITFGGELSSASLNNVGQIVYGALTEQGNFDSFEIFLWEDGQVTQLTHNSVPDWHPDINDDGDIVWEQELGDVASNVMLYRNGETIAITNDPVDSLFQNSGPKINNQGTIVWSKIDTYAACGDVPAELWLYENGQARQLTNLGQSNQAANINDRGQIAWTRYDFCQWPWASKIYFYPNDPAAADQFVLLTEDHYQAQGVFINNTPEVTWSYLQRHPDGPSTRPLQLWRDGVITTALPYGRPGRINDRGQILYGRTPTGIYLFSDGRDYFIAGSDDVPAPGQDINQNGDILWTDWYGFPHIFDDELQLLRRMPIGDLDCDGDVSGTDINPFVLALTDRSHYENVFPGCDPMLADSNGDRQLTIADINGFVAAMVAP